LSTAASTCLLTWHAFTGLGFWLFRGQIALKAALTLDLDWFSRKPAPWLWRHGVLRLAELFAKAERATLALTHCLVRLSRDPLALGREPAHEDKRHETIRENRQGYDPDRYRLPVGTLVLIVLLCFVLLLGWNLVRNLFGA
jgi:multicomponent Na+:H+ antiporter subunit D